MDHRSLTLILFIISFSLLPPFLSSGIHSPTPALAPTHPPPKHIMSEAAGLASQAPPISRQHRQLSPPPPPPPPGKLNLGKKLGLLFAAIAIVLQVTFAAFLTYKRCQLKKMGRRYRTRVSS